MPPYGTTTSWLLLIHRCQMKIMMMKNQHSSLHAFWICGFEAAPVLHNSQLSIQVDSEQYRESCSARRVNKNKNFIFWPQRQMHALHLLTAFHLKCLAAGAVIQAAMVCTQNTTITQQGTN